MNTMMPYPMMDERAPIRRRRSSVQEMRKKHMCEQCQKMFARTGDLNRHLVTHNAVKPYACPIQGCGRRFAQKSACKTHINTHTHNKPHSCKFCGKTFGDPSSCTRHVKERHMQNGRYHCQFCPSKIKRKAVFKEHVKEKHHMALTEAAIGERWVQERNRAGPLRNERFSYDAQIPMPTTIHDNPNPLNPYAYGFPPPNFLNYAQLPTPQASPARNPAHAQPGVVTGNAGPALPPWALGSRQFDPSELEALRSMHMLQSGVQQPGQPLDQWIPQFQWVPHATPQTPVKSRSQPLLQMQLPTPMASPERRPRAPASPHAQDDTVPHFSYPFGGQQGGRQQVLSPVSEQSEASSPSSGGLFPLAPGSVPAPSTPPPNQDALAGCLPCRSLSPQKADDSRSPSPPSPAASETSTYHTASAGPSVFDLASMLAGDASQHFTVHGDGIFSSAL